MTPTYLAKLGLKVGPTDIGTQKINGSTLEIFGMVLASFHVKNKLGSARFFQKTFLVTNTGVAVIMNMSFLTFSNADILFAERELIWRSYTLAEAIPTTKHVELIGRKKFAAAALVPGEEAFVVHVPYLEAKMLIHPA